MPVTDEERDELLLRLEKRLVTVEIISRAVMVKLLAPEEVAEVEGEVMSVWMASATTG